VTLLPTAGSGCGTTAAASPSDEHPVEHRPAVEVVMTTLHAGGKFDGKSYAVSGGLHGVGVSVVNALSMLLEVEVRRDGYVWTQAYERGDPMGPLVRGAASDETGTTITFWPDTRSSRPPSGRSRRCPGGCRRWPS
jgi:Type IIA topoisomerase (DNA gyrase/topo II, topoisomerase IV), B subunit